MRLDSLQDFPVRLMMIIIYRSRLQDNKDLGQ